MFTDKTWGKKYWDCYSDSCRKESMETIVLPPKFFFRKYVDNDLKRLFAFFNSDVKNLLKPHAKILDIGTGPLARFSKEFAKLKYDITAMDVSANVLNYARKKCADRGIKFFQGDITNLKKKGKYDFVFCYGVFSHIPKHLAIDTFRNFNNLLPEDGLLLVKSRRTSVKNLLRELKYWVRLVVYRNLRKHISGVPEILPFTFAHYYDGEFIDIYKRTGFVLKKKKNELWLLQKKTKI